MTAAWPEYIPGDTTGSLVWAGDTYWRIADEWGLRGGIQYDTRLDNVATGNGTIEAKYPVYIVPRWNMTAAWPEYIPGWRNDS